MKNLTVINIEPTNFCNLHCIICGDKGIRPKGFMTETLFRKIAEELGRKCPDVEVCLFLSGEPLIHRKLDKLIKIGKEYGLHKFLIHTNAILMTEKIAEKLIVAGLTDISFSIDGGTKETYEEIRGKGNYEKAVKGVQNFLNVNNNRVNTTVQVIKLYPEEMEVSKKFKLQFAGIDNIYIRYPHSWDEDKTIQGSLPPQYNLPCFFLYNYFNVYWNGDVPVCCADLNGKYIIENVENYSIEFILNNSKDLQYLRYQQEHRLPIDPKYPCAKCERYKI